MKIKKLLAGALLGVGLISLAACDFNFTNFKKMIDGESTDTKSSSSNEAQSTTNPKSSSTTYTISSEDGSISTSTNEPSTAVSSSQKASSSSKEASNIQSSSGSSSSDERTILSLVDEYTDNYSYLKLISDSTYGEAFDQLYGAFYQTAITVLTSNENYQTNIVNGSELILLDKYEYQTYNSSMELPQAVSAMMTFVYDNPIFYFLRGGYVSGYKESGNVTTYYIYLTANPEYATYESRQTMNQYILDLVDDFDKNYDSTISDAKKAKYINDYITDKIQYAYESDGSTPQDDYWAHNIEGFVNPSYNQGVCECYAKSYLLLSRYTGVESIFVTGYAENNTANGHAWNYTKIDDKWYGVDVTWNDTNHDSYMLVGSTKMNSDHTAYDSTYGITYQVELPTLSTHSYDSIFNIF